VSPAAAVSPTPDTPTSGILTCPLRVTRRPTSSCAYRVRPPPRTLGQLEAAATLTTSSPACARLDSTELGRRVRILKPTEKLRAHDRDWLAAHYTPLTVFYPHHEYGLGAPRPAIPGRAPARMRAIHVARREALPVRAGHDAIPQPRGRYPVIASLLQPLEERRDAGLPVQIVRATAARELDEQAVGLPVPQRMDSTRRRARPPRRRVRERTTIMRPRAETSRRRDLVSPPRLMPPGDPDGLPGRGRLGDCY
jgi:hypothetical protein